MSTTPQMRYTNRIAFLVYSINQIRLQYVIVILNVQKEKVFKTGILVIHFTTIFLILDTEL